MKNTTNTTTVQTGRPNLSRETKSSGANGDRETIFFPVQLKRNLVLYIHTQSTFWSSHIARVRINRVRLPILLVVSSTGIIFPLSPFAPENLVSRDGFGSPVPRQPAHLHTQAESGAYSRDFSRFPRRRPRVHSCAARLPPLCDWGCSEGLGAFRFFFKKQQPTTAKRHRVSYEFIGPRKCVPMAFTSPLAQGQ